MRIPSARLVVALTAASLLAAACGGDDDVGAGEAPTQGVATLASIGDSGISGEVTLAWSPDTGVLVATLTLVGAEADATYMAVIAPGCGAGTGRVHSLGSVVASTDGTATTTVEVNDVTEVDLDGGWAVKVGHPAAGQQACGEVEAA